MKYQLHFSLIKIVLNWSQGVATDHV